MKSLFKTVALITFFTFLTRVLGFLFRIVLSRTIGAEGLGLYQVAASIFMVLLTIISSGLPLVISRTSAAFSVEKNGKKEGSFVSTALIYTLILSIAISLIFFLFKDVFSFIFSDKRCLGILLALLPSLVFSSVYSTLRGAMWGKGNYFALCITEFYEQVVRIVVALLIINSTFSPEKNAFNLGLSLSIACIYSMIYAILIYFYYGGKLAKPNFNFLKPLVKQSSPITFMRVISSFLQPIVALIIPSRLIKLGYTSSQALSLYGVAIGMTLPLLFVPTSIIGSLSTALIPDISKAMATNDKNYIEKRISSSIFFSLFISVLFFPFFLGCGEQIGIFLYSNILSGSLLQASAWILLPLGLTNITSALLNSLGYERKSFVNFVIGSIFMFASLFIFPSFLGINGLMWSLGLNYLIVSLLNLRLLKRKTEIKLNLFKPLTKMIIFAVASGALTAFVASLLSYVFPLIINLMICGVLGTCSFVLLCGVFEIVDIRAFVVKTKQKVNFKFLKPRKNKA